MTRSSSPSRPTRRIKLAVHRGLGQVAAELGQQAALALTRLGRRFLLRHAGQLIAKSAPVQARAPAISPRRRHFSSRNSPQQQMFRANVLVGRAVRPSSAA